MEQKQPNRSAEFGPGQTSALGGNKEALAIAAKANAALNAVDEAARLLAERNAALDFAIDQLQDGQRWMRGHLGETQDGLVIDELLYGDATYNMVITDLFAELLRQDATHLCAMGALGAGEGIFSHAAIDAAVSAVSRYIADINKDNQDYQSCRVAYGYTRGDNVYTWNDDQASGLPVIAAFRAAQALPLEAP